MTTLAEDVAQIRHISPLVHNITNYVVMNVTANALLAIGASPVMAHAVEEVEEMAGIAGALVLNIGTLSTHWIDAMLLAGSVARARGIPIILDPVGAGATHLRTRVTLQLLADLSPKILRGNASEILALVSNEGGTKGVDSVHQVDDAILAGKQLAERYGCVVSISGKVDVIVDSTRIARVDNGHPLMARVTGSGCIATVLTGAFAAINGSAFDAAVHAMALSGICGEMAAKDAPGPGTYSVRFLDALHSVTERQLHDMQRLTAG
ncbi:MAG TPA: hydroxyethylthiazole kinase [Polyangiaceae bacterium]